MARKRTIAEIRKYVTARAARDNQALGSLPGRMPSISNDGAIISGADLQKAAPHLELIPDQIRRREVLAMLGSMPKYQVLSMLLDERGKWFQEYPEIMTAAANEAIDVEATYERVDP